MSATPDHTWSPTVVQTMSAMIHQSEKELDADDDLIDAAYWLPIVDWFESIGLDRSVDELQRRLAIAERVDGFEPDEELDGWGSTLHDFFLNGDDQ